MTSKVHAPLIAMAVVMLLFHWVLPVMMPLEERLLTGVGTHVNWIVVVTLLIATLCLGLVAVPSLDRRKAVLVLVGVLLDQGIGELVYHLNLPLYLDTIGSVLVGALLGPTLGAFTASLSCSLWIIISPEAIPFSLASIVTGWIAGLVARLDGFSNWLTAAVSGLIAGLAVAIISSPLTYVLRSSPVDSAQFDLFRSLVAVDNYFTEPISFWLLVSDPVDKVLIFLLVFHLAPLVAQRYWGQPVSRDSQPE